MTSFEEKKERYKQLMHAMQTGVAATMPLEGDLGETSPKHLRVGVNSARCETSALVNLLIAKGITTQEEFLDYLIAVLENEVESYEKKLSKDGVNVKLH